ncbi:MAG: RsmG family class I SAM-dependent methyltransferase [Acidimicrobiales bacterium]
MTDQLLGLLEESRQRGFLGPGPVEGHLDHARAFAVAVEAVPDRALDLGAGGGLPGLVLAATTWPTTRWTLLDAMGKRTAFLEEAVELLGLGDRVEVVTARAESVGRAVEHRGAYDLVVARSFGPPAVALECAAPLLRRGGRFVVSEPPDAVLATRWPVEGVGLLGGAPPVATLAGAAPGVHLVVIDQAEPCPDRYPRRVGVPAKRPLFSSPR